MALLCPNYANEIFVRIISFWNWKTPVSFPPQSYDFYSQGKDGPEWKSPARGLVSLQLQVRVLCVTGCGAQHCVEKTHFYWLLELPRHVCVMKEIAIYFH